MHCYFFKRLTLIINSGLYCRLVAADDHYTGTAVRLNPEAQPESGDHFLQVTFPLHSSEEMADMDELFGSDGDSDNEQRGKDVARPWKLVVDEVTAVLKCFSSS